MSLVLSALDIPFVFLTGIMSLNLKGNKTGDQCMITELLSTVSNSHTYTLVSFRGLSGFSLGSVFVCGFLWRLISFRCRLALFYIRRLVHVMTSSDFFRKKSEKVWALQTFFFSSACSSIFWSTVLSSSVTSGLMMASIDSIRCSSALGRV